MKRRMLGVGGLAALLAGACSVAPATRGAALAPGAEAAAATVYPLSHAVCGRGWTSLGEDG